MIYEVTDPLNASPLFAHWEETMLWSCLQKIMGKIYADHPSRPTAAMAILGDFAFFAGTPDRELVSYRPSWHTRDFCIMVPRDAAWRDLILEVYGTRAKLVSRYAIRKEPDIFNRTQLENAVQSLASGYELRMIDEPLYQLCQMESWSRDLVSQFPDYEIYRRWGLGAAILENGRIVSGASSYSRYLGGIEIEIDTRAEYRQRGLAYVCAARLILECLDRKLYPSWDAQNEISVALAEKLGYHYAYSYEAVEIRG